MSWFVLGGHKVYRVPGRSKEEDLEDGVVCAVGESPEYIDVSGNVYHEIKCLGFKGYPGARLDESVSGTRFPARSSSGSAIEDIRSSGASCVIILESKSSERDPLHREISFSSC